MTQAWLIRAGRAGEWCAIVVRADGLTDYLPATPAGLGELGAFLRLG